MSSPSDVELMIRVRDGDIHQLASLFERHHRKLYSYYVRLTRDPQLSEDLVQEAFFRILKYRHTFRGEGEFTTWMYYLARNVHADHRRKWEKEPPAAEELDEPAAADPLPLDHLQQREERDLLERALSRLPAEKRELLILSRYQDLRYDAIAELLGCSVDAVKVRMHRAMNELRTIFFELSGEKR